MALRYQGRSGMIMIPQRPRTWENSSSQFVHSGILDPKIDDFWIETVGGRVLDFSQSKSGLDAAVMEHLLDLYRLFANIHRGVIK